jgi:hypothetical protein
VCKEDIRLARAASGNTPVRVTPTANLVRVFPHDAERYSISMALVGPCTIANSFAVNLYARQGDEYFPLCSVSIEHSQDHITLDEIGEAITGELFVQAVDTTAFSDVRIATASFKTGQENI